MLRTLTALCLLLLLSCNAPINAPSRSSDAGISDDSPLAGLTLPPHFKIDLYAADIKNARSMALSPSGILFVGTRGAGNVYALVDRDQDNKIDTSYTIYSNGNMPNGVAFRDGDLYVAEISRILKFKDIESRLDNPGIPEVVYDQYPTETHHGWKYIAFGPDNKLYVPVGAPCNICESEDPVFNSITRLNPDGSDMEIVQYGIRNTVGFTWHPVTKELWFTDNGRDWMGDDMPACELNHATRDKQHFGYPYCHQGDTPDPDFGAMRDCSEFVPPVQNLGPHVAPLGLSFYTGDMFPDSYKHNVIFIAEHGSWNRKKKIGYRITMVTLDAEYKAISYQPFIEGWWDQASDEVWGRPVDIEFLSDGSMLISDDFGDAIYRVSYQQ
jgi:glucose/arabinose dehydrogenase